MQYRFLMIQFHNPPFVAAPFCMASRQSCSVNSISGFQELPTLNLSLMLLLNCAPKMPHINLKKLFFVLCTCRIPIRHFFSQSRRLLTKKFWKCNNCKWEMQMLWIRGQGAIKTGLLCSLSAFPSFIKPGTRQTGLTGRFQKFFDMNSWHLLRKGEKL